MKQKMSKPFRICILIICIGLMSSLIGTSLVASNASKEYDENFSAMEQESNIYLNSPEVFDGAITAFLSQYYKEVNESNVSQYFQSQAFEDDGTKRDMVNALLEIADTPIHKKSQIYYSGPLDINGNQTTYGDSMYKNYLSKNRPYNEYWYLYFSIDEKGNAQTIQTNANFIVENRYPSVLQEFQETLGNRVERRVVINPITNVEFAIYIPQNVLVNDIVVNDVNISDYVAPIETYLRQDVSGLYFIVFALLCMVCMLLPTHKMEESMLLKKALCKKGYVVNAIWICVSICIINSVFPTLILSSGIVQIPPYIIALLFVLIPYCLLGLQLKKLIYIMRHKNIKEGVYVTYAMLEKTCDAITWIINYGMTMDFSNKRDRKRKVWALMNTLVVAFITILTVMSYNIVPLFIILILVYGIAFYMILEHLMKKTYQDFEVLSDVVTRTARGESNGEITEDLGAFRSMKDTLQHLQIDFKNAVDQEVQSQKMKTELITNVSHDLKTPLTSIISYIDLLKDEHISEEEKAKYMNVLDNNADRLKHLIENLFEISKANSGNVNIERVDVDIISLIKQVEMECDSIFIKKHLNIRNQFQDDKVIISLDSFKTFRIFENLIGNVGKYALDNTRVFVNVQDFNTMVEVSIKNVSATELDFDSDEIMERFTRGDKSRNSEGSGLGLAIAKSFTELQGGTMKIVMDGDLFKVVLRFYRDIEEENLFSEDKV